MFEKGSIIYIGGFELPDRNAAAHQVLNNAKILTKLGYKVVFCGVNKSCYQETPFAHELVQGFDSYPLPYPSSLFGWVKYMLGFKSIKRVIEMHPDAKCVIAYNVHAIPMIRLLSFCKKKNIRVIANITEWYENPVSLSPIKMIKAIDTALVMKKVYKRVDGIIAVSSYLKDYYINSVNNTIVIPPLVDINEEKWHHCKHICNQKVEFVYSGTIGNDKGNSKDLLCPIIDCLDSCFSDDSFHVSIVGITKDDFLMIFPNMCEKIEHLDNRVSFYGRVSHNESISKLIQADYCIFVRESTRKNNAGFPTKFVEGWTSGLNFIASDISDIAQYFPNDKFNMILDDNSPETIMNAIQKAVSFTPSELADNRRNGLQPNNPFYINNWMSIMEEFLNQIVL